MINRSEASGLTLAVIGHVVLFGLLSVGFLATPNPITLKPTPIEVSLVGEVSDESQAPVPSSEPMAAKLSPVEAPVEPDSAPAETIDTPEPIAKPEPAPPKPAPAPVAKPAPPKPAKPTSAAPAKPQPNKVVKPTGNLEGLDLGQTNNKTPSKSTTPPATTIGADVRRSLASELYRVLKPHWRAPSGADVDKLRTTVRAELNPDGTLKGTPRVVRQEGVTDSNRAQADLHKERAIRAVVVAAPYTTLPPKFYEGWKVITPTFDWKLSQ